MIIRDPNSPWSVGADAERETIQSDLAFLNSMLEQIATRWPNPNARESTMIVKFACYLLSRCVVDDNDEEAIAWIVNEIQTLRKPKRRRRSK
jgi:hypothetical protein